MRRPSPPSGPRAVDRPAEAPPLPTDARHALRTPLHVILGSAELLLDTRLDDAQRAHAEAVLHSARDLRAAIDGFFAPTETPSTEGSSTEGPSTEGPNTEDGRTRALRGRVLVVDDEPVNCRVAAEMLAQLGLEVDVARGGVAALEAITRAPYDLVVTDVRMPDVDGLELTRRVRRIDRARGRDTAIVALTADASAAHRRRCLDAGVDEYVGKPVSRETLASTVARWLPATDAERAVTSSGTMPRDARLDRRRHAIDPATLDDLRALADGLGVDALGEIFELYLDDVPARVAQLAEHLEAGDGEALARTAHSLCGSSGSVGARRLSELSRQLETCQNAAERAELVRRIERESARVVEAMEAELSALRDAAAASG